MSDFDSTIAKFTPRQMEAIKVLDSGKIKYLLYGGALGGGKSYLLRWYAARRLMVLAQLYRVKKANIMLACEDYPSLKLYSHPGVPQPWDEVVTHSQGQLTGTRAELIAEEQKRIDRYRASGELAPRAAILEYLRARD